MWGEPIATEPGSAITPPRREPKIFVQVGSATHPGNHRTRNEDRVLTDGRVFAVADGMGGHRHGDRAAEIISNHLVGLGDDRPVHRSHLLDRIRSGHAEIRVLGAGVDRPMGTTISGIALIEDPIDAILVFNVGDSRVYRRRGQDLRQLTHDHSVVQELIDGGLLAPELADDHPERHVITRSLGSAVPLDIDWQLEPPEAGDRFLIASDGLTNEVADPALDQALAADRDPQAVADGLVELARRGPALDNISSIVVDIVEVLDVVEHEATDDDPLNADTAPRRWTDGPRPDTSPDGR